MLDICVSTSRSWISRSLSTSHATEQRQMILNAIYIFQYFTDLLMGAEQCEI